MDTSLPREHRNCRHAKPHASRSPIGSTIARRQGKTLEPHEHQGRARLRIGGHSQQSPALYRNRNCGPLITLLVPGYFIRCSPITNRVPVIIAGSAVMIYSDAVNQAMVVVRNFMERM